jgi:DNA-binding GntR family transcriptional regulator
MIDLKGHTGIAYVKIRQAIVEGRYASGHRLVEQRIAEEFQLSRTPVREAIRLLDAEGLVVSERNKGATVRAVTTKDIWDLYALRSRLESLVAELAAERAGPEQIARLDQALADFDAAARAGQPGGLEETRALSAANQAFHGTLVEAADNERLARVLNRTVDTPLVFRAFRVFDPGQTQRSGLFHRLIRDAVAGREPGRAGSLMTEHILQGRDALLASLDAD